MKFDVISILEKSDLLAYVERAGSTPRGNGGRYSCVCPLHGGADNPTAFSIYYEGDRWKWHCFTGDCGSGDAISFVQKWLGKDFKSACEWITGAQIEDAEGMKASAAARLEAAKIERIAAQKREEARRKELQVAERHLFYHNNRTQFHKDAWTQAGIDEGMQDFWTLGGCEDFTYYNKETEKYYHTPTMTIPIFNEENELMTIQHRLMNPINPKDKYRPDVTGLHSHPFLAVPAMGFDGDLVWVMEGAKKAMVTWIRSNPNWQCIGVMAQLEFRNVQERLKPVGRRVIVVPDPNSERNPNAFRLGYELAQAVGGRVLRLPAKPDDYFMQTSANENDLFRLYKQARKT